MSKIHRGCGFEDAPIVLMDRVQSVDAVNITQASMTSIAYRVFEYSTEEEAFANTEGTEVGTVTSLTVADVVFDTLQTAAPWDARPDATGYNFKLTLPAAKRPIGGKWHRVEVVFTPTSGDTFPIVWVIETKALAGS